jgi:hypothetical protein
MQNLGGRGWRVLSGAVEGASNAYDDYAEKEIKKQRAESLKEALGGMGYDKYSQFVDPTTGELNELGSTFLKSDLDQKEMAAKYAALMDLEGVKQGNRRDLEGYKHELDYGGDSDLLDKTWRLKSDFEAKFGGSSTGRSGGQGGKPEVPEAVKLNQKRAESLNTPTNWDAYIKETGANLAVLRKGGIDRGAVQQMIASGTDPSQWTNTVNQGEFKGRAALTPDAYLAAKAQGFSFPKGTKIGVSPEQARMIRARSQGIVPSAPVMTGQSPVQPASFASWRKGQ